MQNTQYIGRISELLARRRFMVVSGKYIVDAPRDKNEKNNLQIVQAVRHKNGLRLLIHLIDVTYQVLSNYTDIGTPCLPSTFLSCHQNFLWSACYLPNLHCKFADHMVVSFSRHGTYFFYSSVRNAFGHRISINNLLPQKSKHSPHF